MTSQSIGPEVFDARMDAERFLHAAVHHFEYFAVNVDIGHYMPIKDFLLLRTIELLQKSVVLCLNIDCNVRNEFGHKLFDSMEYIKNKDIIDYPEEAQAAIRRISAVYNAKYFEYFDAEATLSGYREKLTPEEVAVLTDLAVILHRFVVSTKWPNGCSIYSKSAIAQTASSRSKQGSLG